MTSAEDHVDKQDPNTQRPTRLSCEEGVVFGFDAIGFSEKYAAIKDDSERLFLLARIEGFAHEIATRFNGTLLETTGDGAILWAPQLDENAFHTFVRHRTTQGLGFRSGALQAPAGTLHMHSYYMPERGTEPVICFSGPAYDAIQRSLSRDTPPFARLTNFWSYNAHQPSTYRKT